VASCPFLLSSFLSKTGWIFLISRTSYMYFPMSFVMWSPWQYSWKPASFEKFCLQTSSFSVVPLVWETEFHTRTDHLNVHL
jgi:hypothetical protein